jgi:prephenate dehydratase
VWRHRDSTSFANFLKSNSKEFTLKKCSSGAEGMPQVVECLSSKCEALSSNTSTAREKKKPIKKKNHQNGDYLREDGKLCFYFLFCCFK